MKKTTNKPKSTVIKLVQSYLDHNEVWQRNYIGVGFRKSDKHIRIKMNVTPIALDKDGIWLDLWLNDED